MTRTVVASTRIEKKRKITGTIRMLEEMILGPDQAESKETIPLEVTLITKEIQKSRSRSRPSRQNKQTSLVWEEEVVKRSQNLRTIILEEDSTLILEHRLHLPSLNLCKKRQQLPLISTLSQQ